VLACTFILAVLEFLRNPDLHTLPWTATGLSRLAVYTASVLAVTLLWWPLRRTRIWFPSSIWSYLTAIALIYGVAAIGPGPFAATAICCVSGIAVGSFILGDALRHRAGEIALSCQRKVEMSYSLQSRNVRFSVAGLRERDSLGVPVKRRRAMLASNPIKE
jgi:hypothetical protein